MPRLGSDRQRISKIENKESKKQLLNKVRHAPYSKR